ncbi:hypothetical protein Ahy_A09g042121 isoform E [Arachis hypogaea]|uniref:Protein DETOXIFICATION n=1 Tax=Arachis hypogaea TaxID=3818 RepID=A0A445BES8_ARAHY|nr:hypothetical protein Ahy_A09g042121 isoform E [Arachis hypogaea]
MTMNMEEPLLAPREKELERKRRRGVTWKSLIQELKSICIIAGPMVAVTAFQYLLQIVSIMMVGHLGELYLSATALAFSLSTVTGFSLLLGMASGLETTCGQAYGAQQYQRIGKQTYTAIFCLILVSVPLCFIWINIEQILVFLGQDPMIAHEAAKFMLWLVPALLAYSILQPLVRYFQMQSLLLPMLITSCVVFCVHILLCWALVFKTQLKNVGGALSFSISIWLNVIILGLYMRYSSACAKTRAPLSMDIFQGTRDLEWWSFELIILLSGLLPNPQLETSVLSVCLNTISTVYCIPFGIGAAASTRISNELGAGNPEAARIVVMAAMCLAMMETSVVSATLFSCRHIFGYVFSSEKEVVDYVTVMAPLVCLSVIFDSMQGFLSGVARGCGWQHLGVYVNLGAFYLCGIPAAATLAFWVKLRGIGLWVGIQTGSFLQVSLLAIITSCINWEQQAIKARTRIFEGQFSADTTLKGRRKKWEIKVRESNIIYDIIMEESLLAAKERSSSWTWKKGYKEEMKRICEIAGPMVVVIASQYLLQVVSTMMVGHLGELALSSSSLAISLSGVTGFSLLMGMASGLETICGQAYGAEQYQRIGMQTYTAIFSLILVCVPLSILWINIEQILVFLGQDPLIAHEAAKFIIWLIPAPFAYAILQPLVRYFQIQSLLLPMLVSSCVTLFLHIPLCWLLVFKAGLNSAGGALAVSISIWCNVIFLGLFMRYSPSCAKTRAPISLEMFRGIGEFFRFAVPSAVMICLNTISTLYTIPFGIGAAASTRVSNELGAGKPLAARVAVLAGMSLAVIETSIVSATLFSCRHIYGYVFSNEEEVVDYVTVMAPLVCVSVILDSLQGVLTGIARGCGWQHLGVFVNLGAFYLCGIPAAAALAFWVNLKGKGLWIGIQVGAFVQTVLLATITSCINWEQQAIKARKRIFDDMEEGLLLKPKGEEKGSLGTITWSVLAKEIKGVGYLALPMITVNLSTYFLQIISIMMVGHLGKLALSSTAIATSLCAVSGFSVIFGMSCALETLGGQAYGAKQYRRFGVQIYTSIVALSLACVPLSLLWICLGKIMVLCGQDPLISQEAGKFAVCLIPALFAYASLHTLIRYFLMQSLIFPLVMSSCVTFFFHIAFCWILVFQFQLGNLGAAFSLGISYWLNVILLGLYMKFSAQCEKTRAPISMDLFHGLGEFLCYAVPSAGMICLEWWSFELLTLLSGLLPNPELEASVLSICYSITTTIYTMPEAIGSAASTRVSNALGAGSPGEARVAVVAAMTLAGSQALLVSSIIFGCRNIIGYVFSYEQDVLDYVTDMAPLICVSIILDTLHGIARGCGWQQLGTYVNLGAYYILGIPLTAILGFWVQLRGKGLWIGIMSGAFCQTILLSLITSCTNWEKQFTTAPSFPSGAVKPAAAASEEEER